MACKICKGDGKSHRETPFFPPSGSVNQMFFRCPSCGQVWWQFNILEHLWQAIDETEYKILLGEKTADSLIR